MTDYQKADRIVADMQRQFPKVRVRCDVCNKSRIGSWSYLKTGWPTCHGQTMRVETDAMPDGET